jgi:hypothetical protein
MSARIGVSMPTSRPVPAGDEVVEVVAEEDVSPVFIEDDAALSAPRPEEGVTQEQRNQVAREVEGDSDNPLRVREANAIYEGKRDDFVRSHLTTPEKRP